MASISTSLSNAAKAPAGPHTGRRAWMFIGGLLLPIGLLVGLWALRSGGPSGDSTVDSAPQLADRGQTSGPQGLNPFEGARAYTMLERLCRLGPRISGSNGMQRQQEVLSRHFTDLGGQVEMQSFTVRHPVNGAEVSLANLIVHWHPNKKERILLCAHYDTRPFADRDPIPKRRRQPLIGANDGASGTAVLAELARHMPTLESPYGVDFVLFDAEEFVYDDARDKYFLGSEYFCASICQPSAGTQVQVGRVAGHGGGRGLADLSRNTQCPLARHATFGERHLAGCQAVGGQGIRSPRAIRSSR